MEGFSKNTQMSRLHGNSSSGSRVVPCGRTEGQAGGQDEVSIGKINMELQLDATITVLLISKISSTCFGQTFAHLQECKT
jgi:hypothetical protein